MPDQDPISDSVRRTLSEISHLFLSDVRDRQTGGAARPVRVPPSADGPVPAGVPAAGPRLVPQSAPSPEPEEPAEPAVPPVTAVLGAHLGGGQLDRIKQYASHLAARIGRVGLIELDPDELRVMCFEAEADSSEDGAYAQDADPSECDVHDPRAVAEAIEEMSWDVRRWLVFVSQPRNADAQSLLACIPHWALLSTCDHDGVVSSYRMLKLLADAPRGRPRLTLSLLDAEGEPEMVRVFRKLAGVSEQFLDWPVEPEPAVRPAPGVSEYLVLRFRPAEGTPETASHWVVIRDFLARAGGARAGGVGTADNGGPVAPAAQPQEPAERRHAETSVPPIQAAPCEVDSPMTIRPPVPSASAVEDDADSSRPLPNRAPESKLNASPIPRPVVPELAGDAPADEAEVLDLPGPVSVESILDAILRRRDGGLVECPVRPPMCASARLAIGRDRRVVLLAVAREGLSELKSIGQAYRWLVENRALIGMAVPQLAIDAYQAPRLRLLVDHNDVSADLLQPLLAAGHVAVQAYRKVRWGGRMGLLLDAA